MILLNQKYKIKFKSGFTLVELLVVMMIIGLLASLSLFSFQGARKQGRDAKRKADVETIRSALELYKADCNVYPSGSGNADSVLGSPFDGPASCGSNVYLKTTPKDPSAVSYYYSSTGTTYRLCAVLEDPGTTMTCSGCSSCNYQAENP